MKSINSITKVIKNNKRPYQDFTLNSVLILLLASKFIPGLWTIKDKPLHKLRTFWQDVVEFYDSLSEYLLSSFSGFILFN